jgi:hypothetical protein
MLDRAIILSEMYGDELRPPRIIAPLQHLFDPIIGAADFYGRSQWWGDLPVPISRFSIAPRIVFDRRPTLPENLAEAMLYHLQLRLIDSALYIRHNQPGLTFGHIDLDGPVTLLPA